jgi:hypothetical protein
MEKTFITLGSFMLIQIGVYFFMKSINEILTGDRVDGSTELN